MRCFTLPLLCLTLLCPTSQCLAAAKLRITSPSHFASSLGRTLPLLHPTLPLCTRRSLCHTFQNNALLRLCYASLCSALPLSDFASRGHAVALPHNTVPCRCCTLRCFTPLYFAAAMCRTSTRGLTVAVLCSAPRCHTVAQSVISSHVKRPLPELRHWRNPLYLPYSIHSRTKAA